MSRAPLHPLDCSKLPACLFWFGAGALMAFGFMHAVSSGGWSALLRVGSENPLLHQIERDVGPVRTPDRLGHDGQLYYLIARDPFGRGASPAAIAAHDNNGPAYRYRRILFPLLAGGFGRFSGSVTLWGMVLLVVAGIGLSSVAVADLAYHLESPAWAAMTAAFNVGAIFSAMLLTADALALGLSLAAVALSVRGRVRASLFLFALAALTKEVYVVGALATGGWMLQRRAFAAALAFVIVPAAPLAAWTAATVLLLPGSAAGAANVGLPFAGLMSAVTTWRDGWVPANLTLAAYAVGLVLGGLVAALQACAPLLRWQLLPWLLLSVCATELVWRTPSNAVRAFAILWPLTVLHFAARRRVRSYWT